MLDLTQPVQTRGGRPVRILCEDRKGPRSIVGLILNEDGVESPCAWHPCGAAFNPVHLCSLDLVPRKTRRRGWINIFATNLRGLVGTAEQAVYADKRHADEASAGLPRVACVPVEWEQ